MVIVPGIAKVPHFLRMAYLFAGKKKFPLQICRQLRLALIVTVIPAGDTEK